ncbi:MAG TPA: PAS domain S-box protein, partial [Gaiellaceae bacterium]
LRTSMSAPAVATKIGWQSRRVHRLPPLAAAYVAVVAALALACAAAAVVTTGAPTADDWTAFAVLLPLAALARLYAVSLGRNQAFHTGAAFLVAAALVLPPVLVVVLAVLQQVPAAVREHTVWTRLVFNTANSILSAFAAWAVADAADVGSGLSFALAGAVATVAFVATNHGLLAGMLLLARGHSFRESGLFSPNSLGLEFVICVFGIAVAGFVDLNPWLVPALIAPLLLAHRTLSTVAQVRESEERFRAMFESAAMATLLVGLDGRVLTSNAAADRLVGCETDDWARLEPNALFHPDDRDEMALRMGELLQGESDRHRQEVRFISAAGETLWTDFSVALVRDADAKPQFAIAMAEDVTQRRVLEEQLRQSQKLEAVGRLAGGVAHDFNNMLTAISGYTAFALEHAEEGSALRADLDEVRKATERATLLTRQLLAFSRKQVLEPVVLDLNEVVEELHAMLRPLLGADVVLTTDLEPNLGPIEADPSQLNQVVMNLVVNARDAMPDGGRLTIQTANVDVDETGDGTIDVGSYVALTISDEGEGIDEETLRQIFEPFFTTKEAGKGTGLGLATVYGIVKQSGGYVEVESEVGVGSSFRIYLRRLDAAHQPGEAEAAVSPTLVAAERAQPATVLIVEDEEVVRGLVVQVLEGEGYQALVANDGEEALAVAERTSVDVLLTDLTMPKLGGRELAERLRAVNPELKVLYMSGYTDSGILSDGVLPPGTAFLSKPFTFAELVESVRGLL